MLDDKIKVMRLAVDAAGPGALPEAVISHYNAMWLALSADKQPVPRMPERDARLSS